MKARVFTEVLRRKIKAYSLILIVLFLAVSGVTKCSFVPYHLETEYIDMKLPEDTPGPIRGIIFGVSLLNHMRVETLMTYMTVYEFLFLEKRAIKPVLASGIIVIGGAGERGWDKKISGYFDWESDNFAEATALPPKGVQLLMLREDNKRAIPYVVNQRDLLVPLDSNNDSFLDEKDDVFKKLGVGKVGDKNVVIPFFKLFERIDLKKKRAIPRDHAISEIPIHIIYPKVEKINSMYVGDLDVKPVEVAYNLARMPTLRGYGLIPSMSISLSLNRDLYRKVNELKSCKLENMLRDREATNALFQDILFTWAEVDKIDPESRGPFIDARKLAYIEKLMARDFVQIGKWTNPRPYAAKDLNRAWDIIIQQQGNKLLFQACGKALFESGSFYDFISDELIITGINQKRLDDLLLFSNSFSKSEQIRFQDNLRDFLLTTQSKGRLLDLFLKLF